MDLNISDFNSNVTINQVISLFNLSPTNLTNESVVSKIHLFDLYEAYKTREKEQLLTYKWVAYILGSLIMLSNLTVVISSGLILRKGNLRLKLPRPIKDVLFESPHDVTQYVRMIDKELGQQPKSTYLLLGNVSLADTIIGASVIFGVSIENTTGSDQLCLFQLGMLVCPATVSIFSVGLIAVDRYIYILHGLYYKRWFNTTRVRIGIVCIWIIGITLGFMPVTGWINKELIYSRCHYITVFPAALIVFISMLSTVPIIIVTILYSIILIKALQNLTKIKAAEISGRTDSVSDDKPQLRINRGTTKTSPGTKSISPPKYPTQNKTNQLKRSASFTNDNNNISLRSKMSLTSKSTDDLNINKTDDSQDYVNGIQIQKTAHESNYSVCTVETSCSIDNSSYNEAETNNSKNGAAKPCSKRCPKIKESKKWRACTVVLLTSGSFFVTWLPFFVTVSLYVFCEHKLVNPKCFRIRWLLSPITTLAFSNSFLNPLIYAWWHKGFKRSFMVYFNKYVRRYISKDIDVENLKV